MFILIVLALFSFYTFNDPIASALVPEVVARSSTDLDFSTFLGGSDEDISRDIAIGTDGCFYVIGYTKSSDFPTENAYNYTISGGRDVFVGKFSTAGTLLWSTYLGGSMNDVGNGIAIATDGSCYIIGETYSYDFPTLNAFNGTFSGMNNDVFVAKLSTGGSLLWSTYLGGNSYDYGQEIALSSDGDCFVTGSTYSKNFPIVNGIDEQKYARDIFIAKFSISGSLLWSTLIGGTSYDYSTGIAVSNDNSCYLTGTSSSSDFPTKNAYDSTFNGGYTYGGDTVVLKFSATGTLLWSTFFGGSEGEYSSGLDIGNDGSCYLTGCTKSTDFPTLNAYNSTYGGGSQYYGDVYISKFTASGSLLWSTYFGGILDDKPQGIATASDGSCYITGRTESTNFPMKNSYDTTLDGYSDAFVTKFTSTGSLLWSTFFGGDNSERGYSVIATNEESCLITGYTGSSNFPIMNAYDASFNGGDSDAFISKLIDPSTNNISSPGILMFILCFPLLVLVVRKRRI